MPRRWPEARCRSPNVTAPDLTWVQHIQGVAKTGQQDAMTTYPDPLFNGWTNWQTWNLALWLSRDQGLYVMAHDAVKAWRIRNARINLTEEGAAEILMDQLIPAGTPDFKGGSDYVGVDWKAIAAHLESL